MLVCCWDDKTRLKLTTKTDCHAVNSVVTVVDVGVTQERKCITTNVKGLLCEVIQIACSVQVCM